MRTIQQLMIVPAVVMSFLGSLGLRGVFRALRGCYAEYRSETGG